MTSTRIITINTKYAIPCHYSPPPHAPYWVAGNVAQVFPPCGKVRYYIGLWRIGRLIEEELYAANIRLMEQHVQFTDTLHYHTNDTKKMKVNIIH